MKIQHPGSTLRIMRASFPAADLQRLFGTDKPSLGDSEAMLSRLVLVRVGLKLERVLGCSLRLVIAHY
jgi:hypothetical protein